MYIPVIEFKITPDYVTVAATVGERIVNDDTTYRTPHGHQLLDCQIALWQSKTSYKEDGVLHVEFVINSAASQANLAKLSQVVMGLRNLEKRWNFIVKNEGFPLNIPQGVSMLLRSFPKLNEKTTDLVLFRGWDGLELRRTWEIPSLTRTCLDKICGRL